MAESEAGASGWRSDVNRDVPLAGKAEFAPLRIGPLAVWPPVVLAPMAGVTNYPFRALCREFGAGLYVSEMITARGYLNGNRRTVLLASSREDETPRSVQVYSSDPKDAGEMVARLVDDGVHHVDINLGCPVRKVTAHGGGSAIPVKPRLVAALAHAMVSNARGVPVTMKMRKGIDEELLTYREAGRVAQEEGISAVGLHARTAAQLYSGEADWSAIADLKSRLSIPVLGNGDIWESFDALRMMRETRCDGVIVGRGCLGRPWLFRELAQAFDGVEPERPPNLGEVREILLDHARRLIEFFGPVTALQQMRKWCAWYTKGFRNSSALRERLQRVETYEQLLAGLVDLDPTEPFPTAALRAHRGKSGRTQTVSLPLGYLDDLEDATPPCEVFDAAEAEKYDGG
ncbi:MAG: tRNA dihydrouridine synthase DusB [Planctomycetaceae bacterium]|nr:tRNA dihydrouridine synthase DusB [Planctomycetaceae bacterium]